MPQHFYGTIALTQACSSGSQEPSTARRYRKDPPPCFSPFKNKACSLQHRDLWTADLPATLKKTQLSLRFCLAYMLSCCFSIYTGWMERWLTPCHRFGAKKIKQNKTNKKYHLKLLFKLVYTVKLRQFPQFTAKQWSSISEQQGESNFAVLIFALTALLIHRCSTGEACQKGYGLQNMQERNLLL